MDPVHLIKSSFAVSTTADCWGEKAMPVVEVTLALVMPPPAQGWFQTKIHLQPDQARHLMSQIAQALAAQSSSTPGASPH